MVRREFLETEFGKPFTAKGFGNWFRDRCDEAGLPNCTGPNWVQVRVLFPGACAKYLRSLAGVEGTRTPNPRFWRPVL